MRVATVGNRSGLVPKCKEYNSAPCGQSNGFCRPTLRPGQSGIDNRFMSDNGWGRRVERAEELAGQYAFAAEILRFYAHVARFQQNLRERLERASAGQPDGLNGPLTGPPQLPELIASFQPFLSLVENSGPVRLAETARQLRARPENSWAQLLNAFWDGTEVSDSSAAAEVFFARAFLQPYAELVRSRSGMKWDGHTHSLCPFCNRRPGLGVLRQQGDSGRRSLVCSFCLAEWEFRRIVCAGCGEEDHRKLPVYTAAELEHVRVECCDSCKLYMKTVDLTKNGLADPVVDELAAVPLDLWAQERGYAKVQSNLMQL